MCVAPACITASSTFASFLGAGTGEDNREEGEGRRGALGSTEDVPDILRPNDLFPELLLV